MVYRSLGSDFAIARDVVFGVHDGEWVIALVAAHQGDYFYGYQPLQYKDGVLTLSDQEKFSDDWIGPKVHRLTMREATSLSRGEGVEVPNITFSLPLDRLMEMIQKTSVTKV